MVSTPSQRPLWSAAPAIVAAERLASANAQAAAIGPWFGRDPKQFVSYRDLIAWYEQHACHKTVEELSRELWNLPFEPYAPIRRQFLNLLRIINKHRRPAGLPAVPPDCLRLRRRIVKVFEEANEERGGQQAD